MLVLGSDPNHKFWIKVDGAQFLVRSPGLRELSAIRKKHTGKRGLDAISATIDILLRIISDWQDVIDERGQPISCTPETKRRLINSLPNTAAAIFRLARGGDIVVSGIAETEVPANIMDFSKTDIEIVES